MRTSFLIAAVLMLWAAPASGQSVPQGAPFSVTHFTAQEYRAQSQNWGIAQDPRGLMYVANNDGILQYDGVRWRLIETEANTYARSVAVGPQGIVYAGAVGDFGVLRPDSTATLRYVSLSDRLPPEQSDFKDVWNTHAAGAEEVYFQTRQRLFRWNGDTLRTWSSEVGFHTSFVVHGTLYVRDGGRGLLRMEGDSLALVPGGERFADTAIFVMVPHGQDDILIGTRKDDFLLYDGQEFSSFSTEADALLEETRLYHGCVLPGGEIALATLGGGVLIIDSEGELVRTLSPDTILPDGWVNYVYPDGQGGLWMALNNQGIVRAEVSSPLSRFSEGFGLEGIVYDLQRHGGTLYAATGAGLYVLRTQGERPGTPYRFDKIAGVPAAWNLLSVGNALFAATDLGVYRVQEGPPVQLTDHKSFSLEAASQEADRLYVGTAAGLGLLRRTEQDWTFRLLVPTQSEVRAISTVGEETLWFSTLDGTAFRLSKAQTKQLGGSMTRAHAQRFDTTSGLPKGRGFIASFRGEPLFMSQKGLYRVRRTAEDTSFYADTTLATPPREDELLRAFYESDSSNAWLFYDDRVEIARSRGGETYTHSAPPVLQFPLGDIVRAFIEPGGSAWISSGDELIRYDADRAERLRGTSDAAPNVLIREVRDAATGDIIYGGALPLGGRLEIPYYQNSVRVAFALPEYGGEIPQLYQYRLKSEEGWSRWSPDADAVIGKLYEGTYTFQVRSRGTAGGPVSRASLTLEILPPWYRTFWAYLSYLVSGVLLVAGYRHYRGLREEHRRARTEARHHRRETEREREARLQLQKAHDRLEEANRLKENFLANTSHEFRTPLASILGYAEVLQNEELPREQQQEFLDIIRRSGDRLLNTVEMLLEISQLRAGALHLHPTPVEVNEEVETAAASFREQAEEKGLAFHFDPSPEPIYAHLPASYFRRIVENLVDNAVKFTPEGTVRVTVRDSDPEVHVLVHDTGVGVEADDPRQLFDEFKQASEGISREYEGIGLGLTIAGRLVRLMGGSINVESSRGKGSTFTVRLPKKLEQEDTSSS